MDAGGITSATRAWVCRSLVCLCAAVVLMAAGPVRLSGLQAAPETGQVTLWFTGPVEVSAGPADGGARVYVRDVALPQGRLVFPNGMLSALEFQGVTEAGGYLFLESEAKVTGVGVSRVGTEVRLKLMTPGDTVAYGPAPRTDRGATPEPGAPDIPGTQDNDTPLPSAPPAHVSGAVPATPLPRPQTPDPDAEAQRYAEQLAEAAMVSEMLSETLKSPNSDLMPLEIPEADLMPPGAFPQGVPVPSALAAKSQTMKSEPMKAETAQAQGADQGNEAEIPPVPLVPQESRADKASDTQSRETPAKANTPKPNPQPEPEAKADPAEASRQMAAPAPKPSGQTGLVLSEPQGPMEEALQKGINEVVCQTSAKAVKTDPWNMAKLGTHGRCLVVAGKEAEARTVFQRMLSFDPKAYDAHLGLGILEKRAGNTSKAFKHFSDAARVKPKP